MLTELQELGIRIAIDDFGTGYSALGALRDYQVDTIKLDRGFTARIDTTDGKELVLAMLRIARIYGADVVAEGVETLAERDILRRNGCGYAQGYLFAKPMLTAVSSRRVRAHPPGRDRGRRRCREALAGRDTAAAGDAVHLVEQLVQDVIGGV